MIIDCDSCATRGPACADCVVTHFLAIATPTAEAPTIDAPEEQALRVLHGAGLVPPLRLRATGSD